VVEYETNDGWDLDRIEPLETVANAITDLDVLLYELNNCVRTMSLVEMRDKLLSSANEIVEALEEIEDDDKVVEV